jgi:hypothetical protein
MLRLNRDGGGCLLISKLPWVRDVPPLQTACPAITNANNTNPNTCLARPSHTTANVVTLHVATHSCSCVVVRCGDALVIDAAMSALL